MPCGMSSNSCMNSSVSSIRHLDSRRWELSGLRRVVYKDGRAELDCHRRLQCPCSRRQLPESSPSQRLHYLETNDDAAGWYGALAALHSFGLITSC